MVVYKRVLILCLVDPFPELHNDLLLQAPFMCHCVGIPAKDAELASRSTCKYKCSFKSFFQYWNKVFSQVLYEAVQLCCVVTVLMLNPVSNLLLLLE